MTYHPAMEALGKKISKKEVTWWEMEVPTGKMIFGEAKTEMLGYSKDAFTTYSDFTNIVHPEDKVKLLDAFGDYLIAKTQSYEASYRIKSATGRYLRFYDYGVLLKDHPGDPTVAGIVTKLNSEDNYDEEIMQFKYLVQDDAKSVYEVYTKLKELQNNK